MRRKKYFDVTCSFQGTPAVGADFVVMLHGLTKKARGAWRSGLASFDEATLQRMFVGRPMPE
jgi:hypothetical protein